MTLLHQSLHHAKRALQLLRGRAPLAKAELACEKVSLGNRGARWCVCPTGLGAASIVYSFGVGEDISFDLELIQRFRVCVHTFDPTPRSIEWLAKQTLPEQLVFHPCGVADFDGIAKFLPPVNPAHVSHSLVQRETPWPPIEVPVRRLCTLMNFLGHARIDLLKMDIEGAEYSVLDDLLSSSISVHQLLVEFHHRWPEIGIARTQKALRDLHAAGYRQFGVSSSGEEFSFLHLARG